MTALLSAVCGAEEREEQEGGPAVSPAPAFEAARDGAVGGAAVAVVGVAVIARLKNLNHAVAAPGGRLEQHLRHKNAAGDEQQRHYCNGQPPVSVHLSLVYLNAFLYPLEPNNIELVLVIFLERVIWIQRHMLICSLLLLLLLLVLLLKNR